MLRVETMAELFDAAETLALTHEQVGEQLAILTNGDGAGVLATDALIAADGQLATLSEDTITELNTSSAISPSPKVRCARRVSITLAFSRASVRRHPDAAEHG
jgi:acyl-CoA synthetase (NDP forming)